MIEIKELVVKYGDFTAVKDLNISINDGEFFTFLGPSGCGKTTTLRCISGFERASHGKIIAYGKDISGLLPEERNLGFVFQSYALFPSMNVYENIAFGLKAHKVNKKIIKSKVESVAERTGIVDHLQKKVSELSGGQQQRIAIARALVLEPRILLMDEPLSNLDAKLRVSMREEIKRLQKELGITTIYVTHDQEEALAISDRIAVFNLGCLEQIGTPAEIYNQPKTEFVAKFIGDINYLDGETGDVIKKHWGFTGEKKIYVRPQKLAILPPAEIKKDENEIGLEAEVLGFEFQGAYSKVKMRTAGKTEIFSLIFNNENEYCIGDRIAVRLRREDLLVFGGDAHEQ